MPTDSFFECGIGFVVYLPLLAQRLHCSKRNRKVGGTGAGITRPKNGPTGLRMTNGTNGGQCMIRTSQTHKRVARFLFLDGQEQLRGSQHPSQCRSVLGPNTPALVQTSEAQRPHSQ